MDTVTENPEANSKGAEIDLDVPGITNLAELQDCDKMLNTLNDKRGAGNHVKSSENLGNLF